VLGLSLSSSWGNGHATTFRALLKAFAARGHDVEFLERDVPWYAEHRDLTDPDFCRLAFYADLAGLERHRAAVSEADAVIVGSYVPEGVAVGRWAQGAARGVVAFYDIDTPVTLAKLERGDFEYLSPDLIPAYDVYLSFTGGPTLGHLERRYGSPAARALYCSVDPEAYPALEREARWDLSYLGTYSPDRQPPLERLLVESARRAPHLRFVSQGRNTPPTSPGPPTWSASTMCPRPSTRPSMREPLHPQHHPGRHDPGGLLPERAPVRGGRLRHPDHLRRLGRDRDPAVPRPRDRPGPVPGGRSRRPDRGVGRDAAAHRRGRAGAGPGRAHRRPQGRDPRGCDPGSP
jgi:hypothetical protein